MLLSDQQLVDKAQEAAEVMEQVGERIGFLVSELKQETVLAAEFKAELEELDLDRSKLMADLETMIGAVVAAGVDPQELQKRLVSPYASKALARTAF